MTIQCTTCRYLDIEANEEPCNHCGNFDKWETEEYRTVEELEKIKSEIELMDFDFGDYYDNTDIIIEMVSKVIDNHIARLKGEN